MAEKIESDILIEGEGITAVTLAYFLSKYKKNESIHLILRDSNDLKLPHFNPGIVTPIFQLPASLMGLVFHRNINLLKEINTITPDFESLQSPLILLYRDLDSIQKMNKHLDKLTNAEIRYKNLSLEEIENYYPFIRTENEIKLVEIYNSFICSNPFDLFTAFQKLAEENDVYIIKEKEKIEIKTKKSFSTASTMYVGRELVFTTSYFKQHNSDLRKSNLVKLITPIFERFPKISLFDILSASFMWLEEAGYLHIFRSMDKIKDSNYQEDIENVFYEIFSFSDKLEVLDINFRKINFLSTLEKSLGFMKENEIFYLNIPPHLEISLSPIISERIAKLSNNRLDSLMLPNSIFELFDK